MRKVLLMALTIACFVLAGSTETHCAEVCLQWEVSPAEYDVTQYTVFWRERDDVWIIESAYTYAAPGICNEYHCEACPDMLPEVDELLFRVHSYNRGGESPPSNCLPNPVLGATCEAGDLVVDMNIVDPPPPRPPRVLNLTVVERE